jgi:glycosyltransferase involved in cell wall biosynthesis
MNEEALSRGDADLQFLYGCATAVIQASIAEGFGLPIIEAAHFGAPVIASDIRIFHEIGVSAITYFDPMDHLALAARIKEALAKPRVAPALKATLSWKEATERLVTLIRNDAFQFTLP